MQNYSAIETVVRFANAHGMLISLRGKSLVAVQNKPSVFL